MDETFDALREFRAALVRFNDAMRAAQVELAAAHDSVDPLWHDSFRREYDRRWAAFGKHIDEYLRRDARRYVQWLDEKIVRLGRYLHG